jgi:hypothetical protein
MWHQTHRFNWLLLHLRLHHSRAKIRRVHISRDAMTPDETLLFPDVRLAQPERVIRGTRTVSCRAAAHARPRWRSTPHSYALCKFERT